MKAKYFLKVRLSWNQNAPKVMLATKTILFTNPQSWVVYTICTMLNEWIQQCSVASAQQSKLLRTLGKFKMTDKMKQVVCKVQLPRSSVSLGVYLPLAWGICTAISLHTLLLLPLRKRNSNAQRLLVGTPSL